MFDLIIDGREPIRASNLKNAIGQARWIANKDRVIVTVRCVLGNYDDETIYPQ